jgi:hypothetical protein
MDNILAAYETLHTMNTGMKGKKGYMAIKLDMSKAYDRVEWLFWKRWWGGRGLEKGGYLSLWCV